MATSVPTCTSSTRPSPPVHGEVVFETDTNKLLIADTNEGLWLAYDPEGSFAVGGGGGGGTGLSITLNDLTNGDGTYTSTQLTIIQRAVDYIESLVTTSMSLEVKLSALGHSSSVTDEPSEVGGAVGVGGVLSFNSAGLIKDGKTYAKPTTSVMHFDPADNSGYLDINAGQDHFGNTTTNLYWVALHELLHCLGLGVLWDNSQVDAVSTGSYALTGAQPFLCAGGAYYTGAYGNAKYREACGNVTGVMIPLEDDRKHILHSSNNQAGLYTGGGEFGQDIYNYWPFNNSRGVLLRVPKREAFSAAVYNYGLGGSNKSRYVSPIILGMLEDIGYAVDYDNADDYMLINYAGGTGGSPTRNWYGGIPGHSNEFCSGCRDEYPHTALCD